MLKYQWLEGKGGGMGGEGWKGQVVARGKRIEKNMMDRKKMLKIEGVWGIQKERKK